MKGGRLTEDDLKKRISELEAENKALSEKNSELVQGKQDAEWASNAKNKFLITASHDLRQPLHALGLFASSLEAKIAQAAPEGNEAFFEIIKKIHKSQQTLEDYLVNLVDIAKLESGIITPEKQAIDLNETFSRLKARYQPFADEKEVELKFPLSAPRTYSDKTYIECLLGHLLDNGIKFTPKGGEISVFCEPKGQALSLEVRDTGIGIPAAERENIFREFYTLENQGYHTPKSMGLGLAIVWRISELLQHPLSVESIEGEQTVFKITLPLITGEDLVALKIPAKQSEPPKKFVIVVIDDDLTILESMAILLDTWGYDLIAAETPGQALAEINEREGTVGLIITDYRLGEGLSGLEAVSMLRNQLALETPAVLITGDTDSSVRLEAQKNRCLIMHKPLQPAKLRQLIRNSISGRI